MTVAAVTAVVSPIVAQFAPVAPLLALVAVGALAGARAEGLGNGKDHACLLFTLAGQIAVASQYTATGAVDWIGRVERGG